MVRERNLKVIGNENLYGNGVYHSLGNLPDHAIVYVKVAAGLYGIVVEIVNFFCEIICPSTIPKQYILNLPKRKISLQRTNQLNLC